MMTRYIIILSIISLVYGVSANWQDVLKKQSVSNMANLVNGMKVWTEQMQQRRGIGEECIVTQNQQFARLLNAYPVIIQRCLGDDVDQKDAERCCEDEQSNTSDRVESILKEAGDCIEDLIAINSSS